MFLAHSTKTKKQPEEIGLSSAPALETWTKWLTVAMSRPWSRDEFPLLADWFDANEEPLTLLAKASQCSHWFNPLVPESGLFLKVHMPGTSHSREVARALIVRCTFRMGAGQFEQAWGDIISCHRLARKTGQGPTLIDGLVALSLENMACGADQLLMHSASLDLNSVMKIRDDLDQLGPFPALVNKIDEAERFILLDSALTLAYRGNRFMKEQMPGLGGSDGTSESTAMHLDTIVSIDWNIALRVANNWYDRMVDACRLRSTRQRLDALIQIDDDLRLLGGRVRDFSSIVGPMLIDPQRTASVRVGEAHVALMMPGSGVLIAQEEVQVRFELVKLGFALAAYHTEHGSYPKTLDDLAPKYVNEIPKDVFVDDVLRYELREDGYLLYSVGRNGKDDGGSGDASQVHDDLTIRVPAEMKTESSAP
jgi:hypothetical protein